MNDQWRERLIGERTFATYDHAMLLLTLRDLRDAADRAIEVLSNRAGNDAVPSADL